jgi:hypothetical protein
MATPKKFLAALRKQIDSLNVPYREVDRRAGLPRGTIGKLLAGKIHLRVRHIVLLGGVFGISIIELFYAAYGPKGGPERLKHGRQRRAGTFAELEGWHEGKESLVETKGY